ncbi:MAG: hypothetical protein AB1454_03130 [Candidatus Auribacterota bacterium]
MELEKYSSAITLSDMEIFVFPDLMFSLVLANIMSPVIWRWKEESSFQKLSNKGQYRKFMRMKQFIMDNFDFNLDLNTWGLTRQDTELQRFANYISPEAITRSNALFGYQGDKYYFDIDIRRHFGLDQYDSDIIPYWKTETVEAMEAFRYRDGYSQGAGECVSLSALYAAAAYIMCDIPLEDISMLLTPLHSQNFINMQGGILTNNRRIVTQTMWFNGSEITRKAQRALRNEKVTIVSHISGHIHTLYDDASIDKTAYEEMTKNLEAYLSVKLDLLVFASFLRSSKRYHQYFQFCRDCHGQAKFIEAEVLFYYEHDSKNRICEPSYDKLLEEVEEEDYHCCKLPGRISCEDLRMFIESEPCDVRTAEGRANLIKFLSGTIPDPETFVNELHEFLHTSPQLPSPNKNYVQTDRLHIPLGMNRQEIIDYLGSMRSRNELADLAFYAWRDVASSSWEPMLKAALERNPVSLGAAKGMNTAQAYNWLISMPNESIYEGPRLAQPDEVANYKRGDGIEKAMALANIIRHAQPDTLLSLHVNNTDVLLKANDAEYRFTSSKQLKKDLSLNTYATIDR